MSTLLSISGKYTVVAANQFNRFRNQTGGLLENYSLITFLLVHE